MKESLRLPREYRKKRGQPTPQQAREMIVSALPPEAIEELGLRLGTLPLQDLIKLYQKYYGHLPPGFEPPKQETLDLGGKSAETKQESYSVKQMRDFLTKEIPFPSTILEKVPLGELFRFYLKIFNSEPNQASFQELEKELLEKANLKSAQEQNGWANSNKKDIDYLKFLLMKLPKSLRDENNLNFEPSAFERLDEKELEEIIRRAEELNKKRAEIKSKMLVGVHISNKKYEKIVPPSQIESVTIQEGKEIIVPAGYAHYSVMPTAYKEVFKRGGEVWLYLVEGSESHLDTAYHEAHKNRGWVASAGSLPIIASFKLDSDLTEALGLEKV